MADVARVERVLPAPPPVVFDAWLDADSLRQWMCPGPLTVGIAECDPRVGGEFRIVMVRDENATEHVGRYLELTRPSRLVFTWRSVNTGDVDTTVTVDLEPVGEDETRLVLVHEGLGDEGQRAGHEGGWSSIVEKLGQAVAN